MSFDPFGDFETRGYLRNVFGEKDPDIIKHLEHSAFVAGIAEASTHLASICRLSYGDVLHTHEILFRDLYPWAGQDRMQTAPEIAVSKGPVLFAHPRDAKAAVVWIFPPRSSSGRCRSHPQVMRSFEKLQAQPGGGTAGAAMIANLTRRHQSGQAMVQISGVGEDRKCAGFHAEASSMRGRGIS
jgi:hypothetical protein